MRVSDELQARAVKLYSDKHPALYIGHGVCVIMKITTAWSRGEEVEDQIVAELIALEIACKN